MSKLVIDAPRLATILIHVASDLKEHSEELGDLDSIIGDGDLGVTIKLFCNALSDFLASTDEKDIGKLLAQCGMKVNSANPSTFGTIIASAFIGGGKAVAGKTVLDFNDLALLGDSAIDNIKKRGKAEVGGKTLLDSLVPSVNTFKDEIERGCDVKTAFSSAVNAAYEGMMATRNMKARYGRAACFQDSSVGLQDAGATAVYYMIESFTRHIDHTDTDN